MQQHGMSLGLFFGEKMASGLAGSLKINISFGNQPANTVAFGKQEIWALS